MAAPATRRQISPLQLRFVLRLSCFVTGCVCIMPAIALAGWATTILYEPVSARPTSMGFSGVADNTDPSCIYFNPANVIARTRAYLAIYGYNYDEEGSDDPFVRRIDGGGSWKYHGTGRWSAGMDMVWGTYRIGEFQHTLLQVHMLSLTAGAGLAKVGPFDMRFGATAKRLSGTVPVFSDSTTWVPGDVNGWLYDAGLACDLRTYGDGWTITPQFGLSAIDLGSRIDVSGGSPEGTRTRYATGANIRVANRSRQVKTARVPSVEWITHVDAEKFDGGHFLWALGTELAVAQTVFARGGVELFDGDALSRNDYWSWGAGVQLLGSAGGLRIDYAHQMHRATANNIGISAIVYIGREIHTVAKPDAPPEEGP